MVAINNEPWFVAKDVCEVLGVYRMPNGSVNTTNATKKLCPEESTFHPMQVKTKEVCVCLGLCSDKATNRLRCLAPAEQRVVSGEVCRTQSTGQFLREASQRCHEGCADRPRNRPRLNGQFCRIEDAVRAS